MPALKMKAKSSTNCLKEGNGLRICHMSCKISKTLCSQVRTFEPEAELDTPSKDCQNVFSNTGVSSQGSESGEAIQYRELFDGDTVEDFLSAICPSSLETIFSPISGSSDVHCKPNMHNYAGRDDDIDIPHLTADDSDDGSSSSCGNQTCNVSDYCISDMSVSSLHCNENAGFDDIVEVNPFPDFESTGANMVFNMAEKYMLLPIHEEAMETSNTHDGKSCEEATMKSDDGCLYLAIHQLRPCDPKPDINSHSVETDEVDNFDPQLFIRNLPDLSDVVPNAWSLLLPKETRKRKSITLVLDLDETLVHSTLEHCDDADFAFPVFFNMKEHTVYVRQRPYLQPFLERVADMFEIIVFTASQSIYAERLLNILDPERKLFSRRAYRESCIFSDGSYTKDLTVLGVDLAKIAIIDNSPQVFRLQVNNGIPIKSWFDDPSDRELISLLPFLETLVDADDVRPIIEKKFSNKE